MTNIICFGIDTEYNTDTEAARRFASMKAYYWEILEKQETTTKALKEAQQKKVQLQERIKELEENIVNLKAASVLLTKFISSKDEE